MGEMGPGGVSSTARPPSGPVVGATASSFSALSRDTALGIEAAAVRVSAEGPPDPDAWWAEASTAAARVGAGAENAAGVGLGVTAGAGAGASTGAVGTGSEAEPVRDRRRLDTRKAGDAALRELLAGALESGSSRLGVAGGCTWLLGAMSFVGAVGAAGLEGILSAVLVVGAIRAAVASWPAAAGWWSLAWAGAVARAAEGWWSRQ